MESKVSWSEIMQEMLRLRLLLLQEKNFFIAFRNLKSLLNENCVHNLRNGASMSGSVASVVVRFFLGPKCNPLCRRAYIVEWEGHIYLMLLCQQISLLFSLWPPIPAGQALWNSGDHCLYRFYRVYCQAFQLGTNLEPYAKSKAHWSRQSQSRSDRSGRGAWEIQIVSSHFQPDDTNNCLRGLSPPERPSTEIY